MLSGNFSNYSCKIKVLMSRLSTNKETTVSPCCFLYTLPNLEELCVAHGFLNEIFTCEGYGCKEQHVEAPSKLRHLKLARLEDLSHKWEENSLLYKVFQNVTTLEVSLLGNSNKLVSSFVSFQNLTTLEVVNCDELLNLVAESTAKSLHYKLLLWQYSTIEFPSLLKVIVRQCPNMKIFSQGVLSTPRLHELQITEADDDGCWEGSLNMTIQKLFKDMVVLRGLKHLRLSEFPSLKEMWHDQLPVSYLCDLKSLEVDEFTNISSVISGNLLWCLNNLKRLDVRYCESLEEVFDLEELNADENLAVMSRLSEFNLVDLPRLRNIWKTTYPQVLGFRNLKLMQVDSCSSLKYVFTPSLASGLVQLQELEIINCAMIEEIITTTEGSGIVDRIGNTPFRKLKVLCLQDLPQLRRFCTYSGNLIKLSSLSELFIENCPNMETFIYNSTRGDLPTVKESTEINSEENLRTGIQPLFDEKCLISNFVYFLIVDIVSMKSNIELSRISIKVQGCHSLKSVFPTSIARGLLLLQKLCVEQCSMVEEIVAKEEEQVDRVPRFVLPQLTSLRLSGLSRLKSFYPESCISEWPVLKLLEVWKCDRVEIFASDFLCLQENSGESQNKISIRQPLFLVDKVAFPSLEALNLEWDFLVKEILHGKFSEYSWNLKVLNLSEYRYKTAICPSCLLSTLSNLEKLVVTYSCFKKTFLCQGPSCQEKHAQIPSKLRHLKLFKLFDSRPLWKGNSQSAKAFQNVETLQLLECRYIKTLVPSSVSFHNLKILKVLKCNKLLNLVALSAAKSLVQLTKLSISECKVITEVIRHGGNEAEDLVVFKNLKFLVLHCLPSLTSFYSVNCTIEFPFLQHVVVNQCPNMKIFSEGVLSAPKLRRIQINKVKDEMENEPQDEFEDETEDESEDESECKIEGQWHWEGNFNDTIKQLYAETNAQIDEEDWKKQRINGIGKRTIHTKGYFFVATNSQKFGAADKIEARIFDQVDMARDDQDKPECSLAIMTPQLNMVKSASNPSVVNSFVSKFPVNSANKKFDVALAAKTNSIIWHAKLGHPSAVVLQKVLSSMHFNINVNALHFCDACKLGKHHQLPFIKHPVSVSAPLELIYSDIWGPSPTLSTAGFRYYIVFVDAFTRFSWLFPIKLKSDAFSVFIKFQKSVELEFNRKIKALHTDMGGEYIAFLPHLSSLGIKARFSCPHTHQQNGVSERKHRHVVETGLTLLAHANLPLRFWVEAFETATFLINNLPSSVLNFMSPFEKLFSRKPNYAFLKTFGCSCFPYLRYYSKHKFDFHSAKCIFLGYSMSHKGYKCLHPSGKIYVSRHVVFNETEFPYPLLFSTKVSSQMSSTGLPIDILQNASTSLSPSVIPCCAPLAHSPHASGTISNSSDVDSPPLSTTVVPSGIELPTAVAQPTLPGPNHFMMTRTRTGTIAQKRYTLTPQVFTSTHSPAPSPEPKNVKAALADPL
ncbi:hypothetical protein EZV62_016056 [Acer yangbiense]|uniref:Integrase catalytic domain-containing protein n=2 Tax=Acer yangbiense TaxID=1000413 RepID=A0A5C7HMG8_9ROSI|nr:hypothetical protein EZV62_016056 [Acer yangbiense]